MAPPDLRLIVITDARIAAPRRVHDVVAQALAAGAPAIQLRDKTASARQLLDMAGLLLPIVRQHNALLLVNDRLDIAMLAGADGVHLGPDDLPVDAARRVAPPGMLIGCSTDDPQTAIAAERAGANYIGCGAVFGTTSKLEASGERIGVARLDMVARSVSIPVVGIGGISPDNVRAVAATAAAGVAVIGAIMASDDPAGATRALLEPFRTPSDVT